MSTSRKTTNRARFATATCAALVAALCLAGAAPAQVTTQDADLSLTISDTPDPVTSGTPLGYSVEVRNQGPAVATGVALTDQLPGGVDFVSATPSAGGCEIKGRKVNCDAPSLAADASLTVAIVVTVTKKTGSLTNSASVQSAVPDPQASNNLDTETTQVVKPTGGPTCEGRQSTIVGTEGDDSITGTEKRDVIVALGGNDTIFALGGNDVICGFPGDDTVLGAAGVDIIRGASGSDVLKAGSGNDSVGGGLGRDRLGGGLGFDVLNGGPGRDHCNGGPAPDVKRSC